MHAGGDARGLDVLDDEIEKRVVLQRLAGQIDREARDVLADAGRVLAQQFAGTAHDPAIDGRHQLVALGRRQEFARRDDLAAVADHAQQQLEARPPVVAAQWQDRLRIQPEAVVGERVAQLAHHQDVGVAADDALVGILEHLDAIAAAVLGGLAGDLGGRKRMRERMVGDADGSHADADAHLEGSLAGARHDGGDRGAHGLGDRRGRFQARIGNQRGQAVARRCARTARRAAAPLARHSATLTITSSPTCMPKVSLITCSRSMSRYRMLCADQRGAGGEQDGRPAVRRHGASSARCSGRTAPGSRWWRAWPAAPRFASDAGRSPAQLGGLNSASTPMTRSDGWRIGQARIL